MKKTTELERLRSKIDLIDERIMAMLVKRFEFAVEIGRKKQKDGAPVKDSEREDGVMKRIRRLARKPLSPVSAEKIYKVILRESRGIQSRKRSKRS